MPKKRKMKFENGIMVPDVDTSISAAEKTKADPLNTASQQLPVISTQDDLQVITEAYAVPTAPSVQATILLVQDDSFNEDLHLPIDEDVIAALGNQLAESNTPLGIMNKYVAAQYVHRTYLVDNSGSMTSPLSRLDVNGKLNILTLLKNAHPEIKKRRMPTLGQEEIETMTRYEEAEHKIHMAIDDMKNIPTGDWEFIFFNDGHRLNFTIRRQGMNPTEFAEYAHAKVSEIFSVRPFSTTPLRATIEQALQAHIARERSELSEDPEAQTKTHMTLITDGDPTPDRLGVTLEDKKRAQDEANESVISIIQSRYKPENTPIHVWICGEEVKWTDRLDSTCPYVSVTDDYKSEAIQVMRKQGIRFPYTPGMHNACASLAADPINKDDLDMVDENVPFTHHQLNNLLGYVMNEETYRDYWIHNPSAALYEDMYAVFLNEPTTQRTLITTEDQKRRERDAGYDRDGNAPESFLRMSHEQRLSSLRVQAPGSTGLFGSRQQQAASSAASYIPNVFSFGNK